MSNRNIFMMVFSLGLVSFFMGCTAPESALKNKESPDNKPIVGGVAVGISPKVIQADKGENISFTVDLSSTENADDRITISINGAWINETMMQDIDAGANASVPVHITVPSDAGNMSFTVKANSHNLNATASTTGLILIKVRGE